MREDKKKKRKEHNRIQAVRRGDEMGGEEIRVQGRRGVEKGGEDSIGEYII